MKKSGGPGSRYSQRKKHRSHRSPQKKHIKNTPTHKHQSSSVLSFKMPAFWALLKPFSHYAKHCQRYARARFRSLTPLFRLTHETRLRNGAGACEAHFAHYAPGNDRDFTRAVFWKHFQARNLVRLFFREDRKAVRWYLLVILALGILGPGIVLIQIGTQNFYLRGLGMLTLVVVMVKVLPVHSTICIHSEKLIGEWKFPQFHFSQRIRQFFPIGLKQSQKPADKAADAAKFGQLLHLGTYETEIDALYQYVRTKKAIHIEEIAQRFKVPHELVQEWAKILEEHKLITIYYPSFGSPVLKLYEEPLESQQVGNT